MKKDGVSNGLDDKFDKLWTSVSIAISSKNYKKAEKILTKILDLDPKNAAAHNRLGIVLARLGKLRTATHHFKKAVKIEPSGASNHNLGLLYFERRKYKKSVVMFLRALRYDPGSATRHVAIAKAYEKLDFRSQVIEHLKIAMDLEMNTSTRQLFVDAYKNFSVGKKIPEELLDALAMNKTTLDAISFNEYPVFIARLELIHSALSDLVFSTSFKHLSLRSKTSHSLAVAYLHNMNSVILLLNKNLSLASANIARGMFEIYLKQAYGLFQKTNRNFTALQIQQLTDRLMANKRLLKYIDPLTDLYVTKARENMKLQGTINSLSKKYKEIPKPMSYRQIALYLDGGILGENYYLYINLYEKGSDTIHANGDVLKRVVELSGTRHAGLIGDSFELMTQLLDLSIRFGEYYLTIPELSKTAKYQYSRLLKKAKVHQVSVVLY